MNANPLPYPVNSVPPLLYQAGVDVGSRLQCADEITAQGMQAVVSAAVQSSIELDVPVFGISTTNLWMLTVAGSAEGKDSVSKLLGYGFDRFSSEILARDQNNSIRYAAEFDTWRAERDGLRNRLSRLTSQDENIEENRTLLTEHHLKKPIPSISHCLRLDSFDAKTLISSLAMQSKFAFINSTEGVSVLNRKAMSNIPWLLKTFSGEQIVFGCGSSNPKSYSVNGALTTMSVMIQPKPFSDLLEDKHDQLIGSGFLPRFLPAYPLPQRGRRFIVDGSISSDGLDAFNNRVYDVLSESSYFKNMDKKKITMSFSPQARSLWIDVRNAIEASMAPGGGLFSVPEFAGRVANNTARMAANWHYFQHGTAEISASTLSAAIEVCKWHAIEFVRMFSEDAQMLEPENDAIRLEDHLRRWYLQRKYWQWDFSELQRFSPRPIRGNKFKLIAALSILESQGKVVRVKYGSKEIFQLTANFNQYPTLNNQQPLLQSI